MINTIWNTHFFGKFQKYSLNDLNSINKQQEINAFVGFSLFQSSTSSLCSLSDVKIQLLLYGCDFTNIDFSKSDIAFYVNTSFRFTISFMQCCFNKITNGYAFDLRSTANESQSEVSYCSIHNVNNINYNIDALASSHEFFNNNNYSYNNCKRHPSHYSDSTYSKTSHILVANSNSTEGIYLFCGGKSNRTSIFCATLVNNIGTVNFPPLVQSRSKLFLTNCYFSKNTNLNSFYISDTDVRKSWIYVEDCYFDDDTQFSINDHIIINSRTVFEEPQLSFVNENCRFLKKSYCLERKFPAMVISFFVFPCCVNKS